MYDAKKDENFRSKQLQYDCIGDRSYFYMCAHTNMVNITVPYVPAEIIIRDFK
ncbi:hypothetical protein [Clostridium tagluense]|uniref:Uncharacterized protein n=1 Tax=Clostridium tagluense TaxID=360422 RepID=A0A401UJ69_9CLOT|nr:hypothetical protein [Clostridium tagluense]GCD09597.1 hypothetical protein Ctaglu_12200 [Clostridium tagluense]